MSTSTITRLLEDIRTGCDDAKSQLFQLVYERLHSLAAAKMRSQRPDHTLQPTALVNEMAVKLLHGGYLLERSRNRGEFFALAASAMRSVLVDHARRRRRLVQSTGDGSQRSELPVDDLVESFEHAEQLEILALDEALQKLLENSKRQHEIVMLRFFGGLSMREIAEHLELSQSTIEKDWRFAKLWIRRQMDA